MNKIILAFLPLFAFAQVYTKPYDDLNTGDNVVTGVVVSGISAPVQSVNGQTGAVVITAASIGALTSAPPQSVVSVNGQTGSVVITAASLGALTSAPPQTVTSVNSQTGAVVITHVETAGTVTGSQSNKIATAWQNPPSSTNWTWTSDGTNITLTGYNFASMDVIMPDMLDGLPVSYFGSIFSTELEASAITSVYGKNIKALYASAFYNCESLTNAVFPNVETIAGGPFSGAFVRCSIVHLTLGNVYEVGDGAFYSATSLQSITFSKNAPPEGSLVFEGITPSQVSIIVDNPTATGWGQTWNGMPVVRMPVTSTEVNAGTVISITSTTTGTNSAGFFQGDGSLLTGLPAASSTPLAWTPIATVASASVATARVTTAKSVYMFTTATSVSFTNDLSALTFNCTTNYEWEIWCNFTSTNALASTNWDSRIDWQTGVPDLTVTGLYKFAMSTACGTRIQARQTYPTVHQWQAIVQHTANQTYSSTAQRFNYYLSTSVSNQYWTLSHPFPSRYSLLKLEYWCAGTLPNGFATAGYGYQLSSVYGATFTTTNALSAAGTIAAPKQTTFAIPPSPSTYIPVYFVLAGTSSFPSGNVCFQSPLARPMTEIEIAYYNAGGRDFR